MQLVDRAIQAGRCSIAVTEALLRDAQVMLALKERAALTPMALSGPAVAPVVAVGPQGIARATAKDGVVVLVEPGPADTAGLTRLADGLRSASARPTVVIVARNYNQLQMMSLFKGLKIEHVKESGKVFVAGMATPPADAPDAPDTAEAPKAAAPKKAAESGPRFSFVGREDELAALQAMLGDGGPIVVSGPSGIGRTLLIEHAIEASGLKRLPDLSLGRGVGADALFARLAAVTQAAGAPGLHEVLQRTHTPAEAVQAAIDALQAAGDTAGQVMVVKNLQVATGREGDFFRKSRLELLCEALLTHTFPLRLVFVSAVQPIFYREGRDAPLRRLPVSGIKGRFYFDIFQAFQAPEFPRDKFGPMSERLHGHPLAVRTAAVAIRHNPALVDDERFFRLDAETDTDAIRKQIEKRIEKLPANLRELLIRLAHVRYPVDGGVLNDLGVSRKDRMALVAEGVLDMVGTEQVKKYGVHPLVRQALPPRETSNFEVLAALGKRWAGLAAAAEGVEKLAWQQEANRCFSEARQFRDLIEIGLPDYDAIAESVMGLLRSKTPRPDLAGQRITELLRRDPGNADAHLLKLEMLRKTDAKADVVQAAIDEAVAQAPVPEVFHEAVGHFLGRNQRNKAIKVLEQAIEALPDHSRLRTRLAALLLRAGRRAEAIEHLQHAMNQDPMLPDAYGLLGMARREEGAARLDEAETLLREAVRLAPHDVVQTSRLLWLLLDIAKGVPEREPAARAEIRALLDGLLQHDKSSWEAHLLYAVALREEGGEQIDRARWFLKTGRKLAPSLKGPTGLRFDLEEAQLELAEGKHEDAEARLRRLVAKDPANPRVFQALARTLEARGQLVAAFAELSRAAERTSPGSLDRQACDLELARLRGVIEASAGAFSAEDVAEAAAAQPVPEAAPADEGEGEGEAHHGEELGDEHAREAAAPADEAMPWE